jgi:putative DNA primase/helicase
VEIQDFLSRVEGVQPAGHFRWKVVCPVEGHYDRKASLSVMQGDDRILLHCFGGCSFDAVVDALKLQKSDLFGSGPGLVSEQNRPLSNEEIDFRSRVYNNLLDLLPLDEIELRQLLKRGLKELEIQRNRYRTLEATAARLAAKKLHIKYGQDLLRVPGFVKHVNGVRLTVIDGLVVPSRDSIGRIVSLLVRTDKEGAKYKFLGNRENQLGSVAHVPLGSIYQGQSLRITEGVLKADVASCLDSETPTIGVPGVSNWKSVFPILWPNLKTIKLAFDADWKTKLPVANQLSAFWIALEEYINRRHWDTKIELESWDEHEAKGIDDLLLLGKRPEVYEAATPASIRPSWEDLHPDDGRTVLTWASDIEPLPIEYLWDQQLPKGELGIMDGDPGLGKSIITCYLAARMTRGEPFAGDSRCREPANVIMISAEDDPQRVIVPRFIAAGGDRTRLLFFDGVRGEQRPDAVALPNFPDDVERLESVIRQYGVQLVTIDPLYAHIDSKYNTHTDQHIRKVLNEIVAIAHRLRVTFLVVRHLNKDEGKAGLYRGSGSIATIGAARIGWAFAKDPDDDHKRLLMVSKTNLGLMETPDPWVVGIMTHKHPAEGTTPAFDAGYAVFESRKRISVDEAFAHNKPRKGQKEAGAATMFLSGQLVAGPAKLLDLQARAARQGITEWHFRQARRQLGAETKKIDGVNYLVPPVNAKRVLTDGE